MSRVTDFESLLAQPPADEAPVVEPTPEPVVEKKAPQKKATAAPKKATAPEKATTPAPVVKKATTPRKPRLDEEAIRKDEREKVLAEIAPKDVHAEDVGGMVNTDGILAACRMGRPIDDEGTKPLNVQLSPALARQFARFCAEEGVTRKIVVTRLLEDLLVRSDEAGEGAA